MKQVTIVLTNEQHLKLETLVEKEAQKLNLGKLPLRQYLTKLVLDTIEREGLNQTLPERREGE